MAYNFIDTATGLAPNHKNISWNFTADVYYGTGIADWKEPILNTGTNGNTEADTIHSYKPLTIKMSSNNSNDTGGGSGKRKIKIYGYDEFYNAQEVEYTLNGTTEVVSAETWTIINQAVITEVGLGLTSGSIACKYSSNQKVFYMHGAQSQWQCLTFVSGPNVTTVLDKLTLSIWYGSNANHTFRIYLYRLDTFNDIMHSDNYPKFVHQKSPFNTNNSEDRNFLNAPLVIPTGHVALLRVLNTSASTTRINVSCKGRVITSPAFGSTVGTTKVVLNHGNFG